MSGPIPARVDSAAKTLLLDLIDDAVKAWWTLGRICGVLELDRQAEIRMQTFGVVTRVAKELGIGSESSRKWVSQAEIDEGASPGTPTVDARRLGALERDNRELRRANALSNRVRRQPLSRLSEMIRASLPVRHFTSRRNHGSLSIFWRAAPGLPLRGIATCRTFNVRRSASTPASP